MRREGSIFIETIRVLNYIPAFKYGGIETLVMNLYDNIDRTNVQFDFLVEINPPSHIHEKVKAMGGEFICIPKMTSKKMIFAHIKSIYDILKKNKYKIVHVHSFDTRPFVMIISYLCKVKVRIVHAHSTNFNDNKYILLKKIIRNISVFLANSYISCSSECAEYMFGKKRSSKTFIIKNGINLKKYKSSNELRNLYRDELMIKDDEVVIGFIGRFSYLKNQYYAIEIAQKLKREKLKFKILMVGDGETKCDFVKKVKEQHLEEYIECLGYRNDVKKLLNSMDMIIMPSINEGIPLVAIEAQALGIRCLVSDNVSKEIGITKNVKFISLRRIEEWVSSIMEDSYYNDEDSYHNSIRQSGYDIQLTTKDVELYYIQKYQEALNG